MNATYTPVKKLGLVFAGACMFNAIFWHEKLGINTVFYDAFIIAAVLFLYPEARRNFTVRCLLLLQTICLAMVIVHNTGISKTGLTLVLFLFIGFSHYAHRSIWFAGGSVLVNIPLVWETFVQELTSSESPAKRRSIRRIVLLILIPLALAFVFFLIYASSNSVFSHIAGNIGVQIEKFFEPVFTWFSIDRLFFLALGLYFTGWMLLKSRRNFVSNIEAGYTDNLERSAKPVSYLQNILVSISGNTRSKGKNMLALKNENTIGVISLALLNLLLLIINIIDVVYVWFNFESRNVNLSEAVHQGTETLIFSILLAMVILMFFFKANLNFYKKNSWLKYLAYAWIMQNCILVISVVIRDYYYIAHDGLAYKRIGVLFFLVSVLAGLVTVFIKISFKKTNYYLFRINAWVNILLLVFSTTVNWDVMIARYDLRYHTTAWIGWDFLLSLSDKTIPVIDQHIQMIQKVHPSPHNMQQPDNGDQFSTYLTETIAQRKQRFLNSQATYSWLSWNFSDAYVQKYFSKQKNKPF